MIKIINRTITGLKNNLKTMNDDEIKDEVVEEEDEENVDGEVPEGIVDEDDEATI